ncbi:MAG: homoserine dehydrogenase [Anaeromyxobacteraceae bacterium]
MDAVGAGQERPLRVVLLGVGTVGGGVVRRLLARPDRFELAAAVVRHPARHAADGVPARLLSTDPWDAVRLDADLVIEALGGTAPAGDVVLAALLAGRHVVSANKAAVAARWAELAPFAAGDRPTLRFGAAVGGEVPVLEHLALARRGPGVARLRGVLNGTCNFVLGRVEAGATYAAALAEAQALGFAEPDPSADVSGADAAHKVTLCSAVGFGALPVALEVRGIARLEPAAIARARAEGRTTKLVAEVVAGRAGPVARVAPERMGPDDFLAGARGEENRVELELSNGEVIRLAGKGAGRWPTTAAVMADVAEVARALARPRRDLPDAA